VRRVRTGGQAVDTHPPERRSRQATKASSAVAPSESGHRSRRDTITSVSASNYRFARRPKWIAGHILALAAIVLFVLAGLWQVSRLGDRRELNDRLSNRSQGQPIALPNLSDAAANPSLLEWTLVEFDGVYDIEGEVILTGQSMDGVSGHDVLTPVRVGDVTVVVNRGWIPIDAAGPPVPTASPPDTRVHLRGVLRLTQERGSFGPIDPLDGVLDRVARVDLARLESQLRGPVYPMWLQLLSQDPGQRVLPRPRPLPDLGEGPHLSYAIQWFVFAGIVLVGYPILLRRTARPRGIGPSD